MGFQIDGVEWTPKTTDEHATAWLEGINSLLEQNDVKDENGNIIKLSQNYANALYLQILAGSSRLAENDEKLSAGINSFNIELCDEQQIENLLPIAAITRNSGSYSTLVLTAKASEDGVCTIPAGTRAPFGNVNFVVQTDTVIQPGETQNIDTVCDTVGAIVVLRGEISGFATQIPNLDSVTNAVSSTPGNAAETTAELRRRILRGETIPYSLDGIKLVLEELTGINNAMVYFNHNNSSDLILTGNIAVSPRTAYIVINGDSEKLAESYARYMSAPTQNAPGASPTGTKTTVNVNVTAGESGATVPAGTSFAYDGMTFASDENTEIPAEGTETILFTALEVGAVVIPSGVITSFDEGVEGVVNITNEASTPGSDRTAFSQSYTTGSGQLISIKYDKAVNTRIFTKVFIQNGAETGTQITNQIKRDLIAASASWQIGQNITSLLTSVPFNECTYTKVAYTMISTDGENWQNIIEVPANSIPRLSDDTITVEELSQ